MYVRRAQHFPYCAKKKNVSENVVEATNEKKNTKYKIQKGLKIQILIKIIEKSLNAPTEFKHNNNNNNKSN